MLTARYCLRHAAPNMSRALVVGRCFPLAKSRFPPTATFPKSPINPQGSALNLNRGRPSPPRWTRFPLIDLMISQRVLCFVFARAATSATSSRMVGSSVIYAGLIFLKIGTFPLRNGAHNMVFTQGPSAHLPCLATRVGIGRISRSSGIVRFVKGGVVKTFRCRSRICLILPSLLQYCYGYSTQTNSRYCLNSA